MLSDSNAFEWLSELKKQILTIVADDGEDYSESIYKYDFILTLKYLKTEIKQEI